MPEFGLTHPDFDFYADVTAHERDGRFMATADLAEDSRGTSRSATRRLSYLAGRLVSSAPDQQQDANDDEGYRDSEKLLGSLLGCLSSGGNTFGLVQHPLDVIEPILQGGYLLLGIVDLVGTCHVSRCALRIDCAPP